MHSIGVRPWMAKGSKYKSVNILKQCRKPSELEDTCGNGPRPKQCVKGQQVLPRRGYCPGEEGD